MTTHPPTATGPGTVPAPGSGSATDRAQPLVETYGLTKRYGRRTAVDGMTITVGAGEIYGFLGPNGAGKTTTLRMLLGLVRPTSGSTVIRTSRVGALIEGPGFFPYLTGRQNLRVMARHQGIAPSRVEPVLERVGLDGRADDRFGSYSLGMKQRLGVGAALLGDPDLLILDEPTNGLDPAGMADMRSLITSLPGEGRTVLLSSHLLGEVQEICDRVAIVAAGRLLTESTIAEVLGEKLISVHASPLDVALAVCMQVAGDDAVRVEDGEGVTGRHISCRGGAEIVPALTRALVSADADVHGISVVERALEDVFLTMTASRTEAA